MDECDEQQIFAEMHGEILEKMVYDISIGGKQVTNLSYAGVKEAIRRRGKVEIVGDVKIDETATTIRATVKIRDLANCIEVLGVSEADKSKPFAFVLAVNKAERNGFAKIIPAAAISALIKDFLERKRSGSTAPATGPAKAPVSPKPVAPKNVTPQATAKEPYQMTQDQENFLTTVNKIQAAGLTQYILKDKDTPVGMMNALDDFVCLVPYETGLKCDNGAMGFLFYKVLDPIMQKTGYQYQISSIADKSLLYVLIQGKLEEKQLKDIAGSAGWAFSKAASPQQSTSP
jgi:hypothetical protein